MENSEIILFSDEAGPFNGCDTDAMDIIETTIDSGDAPVHLKIGVKPKPARLSDMVPLARDLSDKLCSLTVEHTAVSCQKGCSNCCSYLVPLSIPEVFRLREELSIMESDTAAYILNACFACKEKIFNSPAFKKIHVHDSLDIAAINRWYAELRMPCPFLSKGICSIYRKRPLACREHMVTSAPQLCRSDPENFPEIAELPVSVLEALGQVSAELEQSEVEALILPLAFTGIENAHRRSHRTWPAVQMVKRFVEILEKTAARNQALSKVLV